MASKGNSPLTRQIYYISLASTLGLLVWVVLWHIFISPPAELNPYVLAAVWTIPLLFPLPGIIKGKPYTHAWINFCLMLYFLHSLTLLYTDEGERWLAAIELVLTSIAFVSHSFYAKKRGQELGLSIRKKKKKKE
ncbi:DUF2069 domain-containing protein [Vibrio sp. SS-MA-C1-2]|uniref:DUF2069 domain-containing protein n=1 Tax=Vibrio sp. SS-MA-C1-2 TaxID=2908646 RepID=UPI001F2510F1|nr:DUF2069 domain-containing protein [Vibrio sp. SS-MA-C1-2]UJF19781.1 DUF2069 domain-containing protein [Vibrio sp. SS-MA-C1-2]